MMRIRLTLLLGLWCISPACGGRSNNDVPGSAPGGAAGASSRPDSPAGTASGGAVIVGAGTGGIEGVAAEAGVGASAPNPGGTGTGSGGVGASNGGDSSSGQGGDGGDAPQVTDFTTNVLHQLNGFVFTTPCLVPNDVRTCSIHSGSCPYPNDADPVLGGWLMVDRTLMLGGDPSVTYEITLHVQGLAEAKLYKSGVDQDSAGEQRPADGFYTGGTLDLGNARTAFMIRVGQPAHDYFLNSIATESDDRLRYSVFPIDYSAKIRVQGGTSVRLVASDTNCIISRNCDDLGSEYACKAMSASNLEPDISQHVSAQPYDGQFLGLAVTGVAVVP